MGINQSNVRTCGFRLQYAHNVLVLIENPRLGLKVLEDGGGGLKGLFGLGLINGGGPFVDLVEELLLREAGLVRFGGGRVTVSRSKSGGGC